MESVENPTSPPTKTPGHGSLNLHAHQLQRDIPPPRVQAGSGEGRGGEAGSEKRGQDL